MATTGASMQNYVNDLVKNLEAMKESKEEMDS